ncbi:MAG TPA: DUF4194 domain-containing protein [Candidatus Eisenbergiella stercorigallinarum]|uniref:DUF4194 domain-containing protein n=1 Tax=Candidatus Eisenbergiella stercorigallinarum TaxID=2838557 RepID=A0A9D2U0U2_9FIRM|nr:DUF4194 domain-containing protein [Candidatus Eisenbergiella stercorigallinarum]
MLEYISRLSNADQERMQSVLSQLYRQTFLLERKYDKRAGRLVLNHDYDFCEQHMEFLKDYLDVAGILIEKNTELGAIYIQGQTLLGERLPKLATIYLLLLKLIYDEQMAAVSSSVNIVTTFGALSARAGEFRLTRSLSSVSEIRRALAILKKYQMIEPLDALEELNEGTRILIYPCINLLLMREDIRKLLAVFGEEAGGDGAAEEITAADEAAAEEEATAPDDAQEEGETRNAE